MKRITAAFLICLVCLCGCAKKDAQISAPVQVPSVSKSEKPDSAKVRTSVLSDIGLSAEEFISLHGEPEKTEWAEGPLYRFSDSAKWFTFSQYEFDGDEYFPKGKCTEVVMPLYELIDSESGEYGIDTVKEAVGTKLRLSYNEMDELPCYEADFKNYKFVIYANDNGSIDENSNVDVSQKEE